MPYAGSGQEKTEEELKADIDALSQVEMARLVRYAKVGHPYFAKGAISDYFEAAFKEKGGMTPAISKEIGWTS